MQDEYLYTTYVEISIYLFIYIYHSPHFIVSLVAMDSP